MIVEGNSVSDDNYLSEIFSPDIVYLLKVNIIFLLFILQFSSRGGQKLGKDATALALPVAESRLLATRLKDMKEARPDYNFEPCLI